MQLAICWSWSSNLLLSIQKYNCSSHIVTPFIDVLFGVIHTMEKSIRKVTAGYRGTVKRLINLAKYTSSYQAFAMNATDHINVVFQKFAYSLVSRVIASPNSIVTAIVNSDAYLQSPQMNKWESML